jgi:hypothetical protein
MPKNKNRVSESKIARDVKQAYREEVGKHADRLAQRIKKEDLNPTFRQVEALNLSKTTAGKFILAMLLMNAAISVSSLPTSKPRRGKHVGGGGKSLVGSEEKIDQALFERYVSDAIDDKMAIEDRKLIERAVKGIRQDERQNIVGCLELILQAKGDTKPITSLDKKYKGKKGAYSYYTSYEDGGLEIGPHKISIDITIAKDDKDAWFKTKVITVTLVHESLHCLHALGNILSLNEKKLSEIMLSVKTEDQFHETLDAFIFGIDGENIFEEKYKSFKKKIEGIVGDYQNPKYSKYFIELGKKFYDHYDNIIGLEINLERGIAIDEIVQERIPIIKSKQTSKEDRDDRYLESGWMFLRNSVTSMIKVIDKTPTDHKLCSEILAHLNSYPSELRKAIDPDMNKFISEMKEIVLEKADKVMDEDGKKTIKKIFGSDRLAIGSPAQAVAGGKGEKVDGATKGSAKQKKF